MGTTQLRRAPAETAAAFAGNTLAATMLAAAVATAGEVISTVVLLEVRRLMERHTEDRKRTHNPSHAN